MKPMFNFNGVPTRCRAVGLDGEEELAGGVRTVEDCSGEKMFEPEIDVCVFQPVPANHPCTIAQTAFCMELQ